MFDFDLILGLFFTLLGSTGLFLGSMWGSKTVLRYKHVAEQLSFSIIPSNLTFEFDLILVLFLNFWGPIVSPLFCYQNLNARLLGRVAILL